MVPPKLDWDRPPWNRWAFQHIREFLPTVEVWRGNGHRQPAGGRAERDLDDLAYRQHEGRTTTLAGPSRRDLYRRLPGAEARQDRL